MSTQARDHRDRADDNPQPKFGAGALAAMGRLGLHELRSVVQAFPDSNVVQPTEMGVLGTKSAQEVVEERRRDVVPSVDREHGMQHEGHQAPSSLLDAHVAKAKAMVQQGRGAARGHELKSESLERDSLERERE